MSDMIPGQAADTGGVFRAVVLKDLIMDGASFRLQEHDGIGQDVLLGLAVDSQVTVTQ